MENKRTPEMEALREKRMRAVHDRDEIDRRIAAIDEEILALAASEQGIGTGTIVVSNGIEYRVTCIGMSSWLGELWLKGVPRKKDGTWGNRERALYNNWQRV